MCSKECSMIYNTTIRSPKKYENLRRWIENNQAYKFIRVWDDGRSVDIEIINENMLNFDFMRDYKHLIDFESANYKPEIYRLTNCLKYYNEGKNKSEIAELMHVKIGCVSNWIDKLRSIDFDLNRYDEINSLIANKSKTRYNQITNLLDEGYNNYQVSKILNISPSTVLRVLRRFNDDRANSALIVSEANISE